MQQSTVNIDLQYPPDSVNIDLQYPPDSVNIDLQYPPDFLPGSVYLLPTAPITLTAYMVSRRGHQGAP